MIQFYENFFVTDRYAKKCLSLSSCIYMQLGPTSTFFKSGVGLNGPVPSVISFLRPYYMNVLNKLKFFPLQAFLVMTSI